MALVILKTRARTTMGINLREKLASTFHTILLKKFQLTIY